MCYLLQATSGDSSVEPVQSASEGSSVRSNQLIHPGLSTAMQILQQLKGSSSVRFSETMPSGAGDSSVEPSQSMESEPEGSSVKTGPLEQSGAGDSSVEPSQSVESEPEGSLAGKLIHPGLSTAMQILQELSPRPKIATARARKRKAESAAVITLSPYKQHLESEAAKKKPRIKAVKQQVNKSKKQPKSSTFKQGRSATRGSCKGSKAPTRAPASADDTEECLYCNDSFSNEGWIQCQICAKWAHNGCAGVGPKCDQFVCEICDE